MKLAQWASLDRAVERTITHQPSSVSSQSRAMSAPLSRMSSERLPTRSSSGVSLPSPSSSNKGEPLQISLYSYTSNVRVAPTPPRSSARRVHAATPHGDRVHTRHRGNGEKEAASAARKSFSHATGRDAENAPEGRRLQPPHHGQTVTRSSHRCNAPRTHADGHPVSRRRRDSYSSSDEEESCRGSRRAVRRDLSENSAPLVAGATGPSSVPSSPPRNSSRVVKSLLPPSSVATCVLPLDAKFIELLYCLSPASEDRKTKLRVIDDIRTTVQRVGLDIQIYGSLCTGLMIPASDVDCVIMRSGNEQIASAMADALTWAMSSIASATSGSASQRSLKGPLSTAIRTVANRMRRSHNFTHVTSIAHAQVPIVKCWHRRESVRVDLSFEHSGCASSNFLCKLFCEPGNEMARPLIVLVKALVNNFGLGDPSIGGLGSFPISLLVLWYIEQCVRTRFSAELQRSIGVLFVGFLKYYAHEFDFRHNGIDYVQRKTFTKAPADDLYIVNPMRPGTNCAKAATLFATRVVPLFQKASSAFVGFLDTLASPTAIEFPLLHYFSKAASNVQSWRDVSRRAAREPHLEQNLWDSETNMYVGGVL
ncbi:hypothetical protein CUR178_03795 [Leishmania enriettii]|uniref:DNA polymerase sigma-like protein n=1 Tax=Leishmania enriettii TaxID=5663 RepID=A0A836HH38_LEIEN|nr:hypothetical protein CUR178_03795 [Leishmania enriettii]